MQELNTDSTQALITLGLNIETARRRRGLSQKAVCMKADITPQTYRRLIHGDSGISLGVLLNICQVMGVENMLANLLNPDQDKEGKRSEASKPTSELDDDGRLLLFRRPKVKQLPSREE